MRCNAAATQDKVQLATSTVELQGEDCSETISARPIGDTIVLWSKNTGGNGITDTDSNTALSRKNTFSSLSTLNVSVRMMNLGEWSIDIDLIEESDIQVVESRDIDSDAGHEGLQIFAISLN